MNDIRVSIVIPAWNESDCILCCLKSVTEQTVPAFEIIVVDNKSTDDTVKKVKKFIRDYEKGHKERKGQIKLISQNDFQGLIPTRNAGLEVATGDIVGRIDADAIICPSWVAAVQETFSNPEVMGATGPVTYYDMPARKFSYHVDNSIRKLIARQKDSFTMMFGTNMVMRKSALNAIGREFCLDREDVLHEDIDISLHFSKHGYKVVYAGGIMAGMSARRIEDKFSDFKVYQQRMLTTYEKHGLEPSKGAKMSRIVFLVIWWPLHAMRIPYMKRFDRLKDQYLDEFWQETGKMGKIAKKLENPKPQKLAKKR